MLAMVNHTHLWFWMNVRYFFLVTSRISTRWRSKARDQARHDMDLTCVSSHSVKLSSWQSWHENLAFTPTSCFLKVSRFCTMIHQIHPSGHSPYIQVSTCLLEWCLVFWGPGCAGRPAAHRGVVWCLYNLYSWIEHLGVLKSAVFFLPNTAVSVSAWVGVKIFKKHPKRLWFAWIQK